MHIRLTNTRWVVAILVFMMSIGISAFAQNPTGGIDGTVMDPSGAVIPGATVTATNTATGLSRNFTTDNLGTFRFVALPPGEYRMQVEAQGFSTQTQTLVVRVGTSTTAKFTMMIGQTSEVIEVTGAAAAVSVTESTNNTTFDQVQVESLPLNGRGFLSIAALDPGTEVQYVTGDRGGFPPFNAPLRVAIASPFTGELANVQANIQVDGIRVNDRFAGNASMNYSAESIQEFQLNTLTFDLSSGTSASGVVNTVSRSGSNDLHGSAFFYFRDHNMAAYPALVRSDFNPDPFFARKQLGFGVGGPIAKDKLTFFANYEKTAQLGVREVLYTDPIVAPFNHIARAPYDNDMGGIRLDYNMSDKHNGFFRYNMDYGFQLVGGLTMESNWVANYNRNYQSVLGVTSTFSAAFVNDFRFGYTYSNSGTAIPTMEQCLQAAGNPDYCVGLNGPLINFNVGGLTIGTNWLSPEARGQRVYQFTDNVISMRGDHSLRFGGSWEHYHKKGNIGSYVNGTFDTYSPVQLQGLDLEIYNALPASLRSVPGTTATMNDLLQLPVNGMLLMGVGDFSWPPAYKRDELITDEHLRLYFQDSWQIRSGLTMNYGLGWSFETGMPYRVLDLPEYVAPLGFDRRIIPLLLNHFEPALGFAWSPDNKTVFRTSAAIHWASQNRLLNRNSDMLMRSPAGIGSLTLASSRLANPKADEPGQPPTLVFSSPVDFTAQDMSDYLPYVRQGGLDIINQYDGKDLSIRNIEVFKTSRTGGMGTVYDANFRTPYTFQVNVGFARQLAAGFSLSADYIMIRSIKFGANDVYSLDYNRWSRYSDYVIDPVSGAGRPGAFRNPVLPVCTPEQALDPTAQCASGTISLQFSGKNGRYNSLQLKLKRSYGGSLQFGITYALTKTTAHNGIENWDNFHQSYGITSNPKHKWTANATWSVPKYEGSQQVLRGIANGWQLGFMTTMRVGLANDAMIGSYDINGDGISSFRLPGMDYNSFGWSANADDIRRLVDEYNATYPAPADVALKDIPRSQRDAIGRAYPYIILPDNFSNNDSFMTHDLRLTRNIDLTENAKLQLSVEGFNIFNIANVIDYSRNLDAYVRPAETGGTPTLPARGLLYGQPTHRVSAIFGSGGPRAFQFAARFTF
jgi:hypothetical protein